MITQQEQNEVNLSKERAQELRRLRGEISCAECRRLKLRCDKKVPCSSCKRRGCATICPNGTFVGGHSARQSNVDVGELDRKLQDMSNRIRELEDALQASHARMSPEPHPLLVGDFLAIKQGLDVHEANGSDTHEVLGRDTLEAFGKLTLSENAGTLGLLGMEQMQPHKATDSSSRGIDISNHLPIQISLFSKSWPFEPVNLSDTEFRFHVMRYLPSWERATALCEAYLENLSWFLRLIDRDQLVTELMPMVYGKRNKLDADGVLPTMSLHSLALLLSVFAAGAAGDFTQPQYNEEAETYYHLARVALGMENIFDDDGGSATLETVQAVSLLGAYHVFSARKGSFEAASMLLNIAYCIAGSIGLHREPSRWNLEPKVVQRRRNLFWELFSINNWHGLSFGRPIIFCLHSTDCELPDDLDASTSPTGTVQMGFWRWKYLFAKEVLGPIAERMCVTSPMKYSTILEMDRRARAFHSKHLRQPTVDVMMGEWNLADMMQYESSSAFVEIVSLVIHRNFFAKAIIDYPQNPLQSPFAPSFLSAYRSAVALLRILREQYERRPQLMDRLWLMRGHSLGAVMILASVVLRTPTSELAQAALLELGLAVSLFERTASHPALNSALPIVSRLYDRAQRVMYGQQADSGTIPVPSVATTKSTDITSQSIPPIAPTAEPSSSKVFTGSAAAAASQYTDASELFNSADFTQFFESPNASASFPNLAQGSKTFDELIAGMDVDMGAGDAWKAFVDEQGFGSEDFGEF